MSITDASDHFIQGMSRISQFWGFPKAMGAIYGAAYLSPRPISLDDLAARVRVSKGAASTNVRHLERLKMVQKVVAVGDRKDYYTAETDFWKIVKGVLREREKHEFDRALRAVGESLEMVRMGDDHPPTEEMRLRAFLEERLGAMETFFHTVDTIVAAILAVEEFRLSAFSNVFRKLGGAPKSAVPPDSRERNS